MEKEDAKGNVKLWKLFPSDRPICTWTQLFSPFLFLRGLGPYYRAQAPAGRTSPIASLLEAAGKLENAITQDILKAANKRNIVC